jgi:DNA-binding NtrC family response regulator
VTAAEPAPGQAALSTLPPPPDEGELDISFKERLLRWETGVIAQALARTDRNVRAAARLLRMPHQTLVYKLKIHGLSERDP